MEPLYLFLYRKLRHNKYQGKQNSTKVLVYIPNANEITYKVKLYETVRNIDQNCLH